MYRGVFSGEECSTMRLIEARIQNFRSIVDANLRLDQTATVLVGGNEQGKTSVLTALQLLDPKVQFRADDLTHRVELRDSGVELSAVPVVTGAFVTPADIRGEVGADVVKLTRFADGHFELVAPAQPPTDPGAEAHFDVMANARIKALLTASESAAARLADLAPSDEIAGSLDDLSGYLRESLGVPWVPQDDENLAEFDEHLRGLVEGNGEAGLVIAELVEELTARRSDLAEIALSKAKMPAPLTDRLVERVPRFVYFRTQDLLEDQVSLSDLQANPEAHPILRSLLRLCPLDPVALVTRSATQRAQATAAASTRISAQVNEYWDQAHVDIRVQVDGGDLLVLIDEPGAAPLRPSQRSDGFQWFLSFYVALTEGTGGDLKGAVLLLDDPGVYLHASGQADLLRTLESLANTNQVVFATHSPFLIDRSHLERVRLVQKTAESGTSLVEKFWDAPHDALAPIRAAMGMSLGQSLFSSDFTVAVEGLSDYYLIHAFNEIVRRTGGSGIDWRHVQVLPVGGGQARYMVPLLAKERHHYLVIFDSDGEANDIHRYLRKEFDLPVENLLTLRSAGIAPFGQKEFEVEDLPAPGDYLEAVNASLVGRGMRAVPQSDLDGTSETSPRIVRRLQRLSRDKQLGDFDKISAALSFRSLVDGGHEWDAQTIENATKLIALITTRASENLVGG